MGEILKERSFTGPDEFENLGSTDDFERSVRETIDQIPVTPLRLPEHPAAVDEVDWPASFYEAASQMPPNHYQQYVPSENRRPPVYDGVWSVDPDTIDLDPFDTSR